MTSRPSTDAPILAVLAIVLPCTFYVVGYFYLPDCSEAIVSNEHRVMRIYDHSWQAYVFRPAAWLESIARHRQVRVWDWETAHPG